jgi:hypothetical protein
MEEPRLNRISIVLDEFNLDQIDGVETLINQNWLTYITFQESLE